MSQAVAKRGGRALQGQEAVERESREQEGWVLVKAQGVRAQARRVECCKVTLETHLLRTKISLYLIKLEFSSFQLLPNIIFCIVNTFCSISSDN